MSGHSKWSSIKHQKGVADARRGQLFTKLTKEIIVAVRQGGDNPEANFRLRLGIQKARDNNMPLDNIERAIKRGNGTLEGTILVEMVLEGYGPSGVAILVQALSDNRNRTLQEVRNVFSRSGGSLGENGCVAWIFDTLGLITIDVQYQELDKEDLALQAIDAGADDVKIESDHIEVYTKPDELEKLRQALEENNFNIASAELSMIPKTLVDLEEKAALQTLKMLDKLEGLDDVQQVYSNVNFSDEILEKYRLQA
ncbi:MAG: YebC/PmpR family DNA-binding transcriptional regulator [Dehalococcoidales bacterium]|nr:YebC/PmpR family DNA-binding transcriptional regulator [Dehalococcoidales bacterium]